MQDFQSIPGLAGRLFGGAAAADIRRAQGPASRCGVFSQAASAQPEAAVKCPRCESTNTKFCYFNNYSLTQPRHFCHTCGRSWTRGGALRSVRVGSRYSCHAKRSTKSKASAREPAAAAGTASSALTATTPNTTSCTGTAPPGFNQYSMFCTKSASPHSNWFADNFDPASPGFGSPARLLFPQQVLKGVDIGLQSGSGGDCEDGASSTTK